MAAPVLPMLRGHDGDGTGHASLRVLNTQTVAWIVYHCLLEEDPVIPLRRQQDKCLDSLHLSIRSPQRSTVCDSSAMRPSDSKASAHSAQHSAAQFINSSTASPPKPRPSITRAAWQTKRGVSLTSLHPSHLHYGKPIAFIRTLMSRPSTPHQIWPSPFAAADIVAGSL